MSCANAEIAERVNKLVRDIKEINPGFTIEVFARAIIGPTKSDYQRMRNCLTRGTAFSIDELIKIADFFDVSLDKLCTGTATENRTVVRDLGLTDNSVAFLQKVSSTDGLIDNGMIDGYADNEITTVTSMDDWLDCGIGIEALYPHEIKSIVNTLLSTKQGRTLLALMYKYVHVDFSSGLVNGPDENFHDITTVCDEIVFSSDQGTKTSVPVSLMRYSISQGIISVLDDLRENAKGDN